MIAALWSTARAVSPWVQLGINASESLPGLLYLVWKGELPRHRGELVAFRPPANRFYPHGALFVKQVVGFPGNRVTRDGRDFYINGGYVATAKQRSRSGEPLTPGPQGVIPPDAYFVWTSHPDSYDSRYEDIGWIRAGHIVGRAFRVL